jgi:acyl-CoA thioesterase FadM
VTSGSHVSEPQTLDGAANGIVREYRVRFDEAGPSGLARTSALLRYAQDIAWLHADEIGFDREWYRERGLGWLVRAAELEVRVPIPMGHRIRLETAVVGHRRVWARRRVEVRLPDGLLAAWVHTDWVMIDARGAIARIPAEFGVAFPCPLATYQVTRADLSAVPAHAHRARIVVRPQELDPNAHVNNAAYLDWLEEGVLAAHSTATGTDGSAVVDQVPRRYRLEFLSATASGASLEGTTWHDGTAWNHRLTGVDGREAFRARLEA